MIRIVYKPPLFPNKMTPEQLLKTTAELTPSDALSPLMKALWYDAKGDWSAAHEIAQEREGTLEYDHLHAYLHRKEGDNWNANYWYRRARVAIPIGSLEDEWRQLVALFQK
jgi:hypothetical protein